MIHEESFVHPSFTLAASLAEPWRSHFPKSVEEAREFQPLVERRALSSRVLAVMTTRVECTWAAYCDAVPGRRHGNEMDLVLHHGSKLPEAVARALFPHVPNEVPYAR